jgi:myosin heavy subunit
LTTNREEQIDAINKMQRTILKPTPVSFGMDSVEILNGRMVTNLEQSILYLIKMTNRQKMDQVMDLENQLSKLTEALQEEFENIRNKKSPLTPNKLRAQLDKIQQTLQKMMDKLSQQNQTMPDEFLNSKATKSLNLEEALASLEKIKDLASQGKMDEALAELKKVAEDLRMLANQLDQAKSSMDSLVDNQIMEQINESVMQLEILERKQKAVLQETSEINQKLRANQARQFDSLIKSFFDELKKDVQAIQDILEEDSSYLDEHRAMIKTHELMQEEAKIRQKIKSLNQKTIDSSLNEDLADNFKTLNDTRRQLSKTISEIDNLRTRGIQEFKENLPQIKKKYETLKELTELNDLNEFNVLFKNTYPEIFRWQGNMRTSRNQDIGDRLNQDLREIARLNAEISKKLGSMKRSIEKNSQALLTDKEKTKLSQLAKREKEMSQQAKEMRDLFNKMNQENPLLPPSLSQNMGNAERNLKNAQNRLKARQVQRGIDSENKALKSLQATKKLLNEIKNSGTQMSDRGNKETPLRLGTGNRRDPRRGGSPRMQKERVLLPSEDQYKVPRAFREEILDAMKKQTPKNYERLVNEYYKELVQ